MESQKTGLLEHLEKIAFFLELNEENVFKIRAFKRGLEVFEALSDEELLKRVKDQTLMELEGIGKGLSEVTKEFLSTHNSAELKRLTADWPDSLYDMRKLKGLGAKKIGAIYKALHIINLGELEYACVENRLVDLPGFGQKTQDKILAELQLLKARSGKLILSDALKVAEKIESKFPKNLVFRRVGSLGRKLEVVEQIEYLVANESIPKTSTVPQPKGKSKSVDLKTKEGFQLIYHFCSMQDFMAETVRRTSSGEHWTAIEKTKSAGSQKIKSEEEFYQSRKLAFQTEECREFASFPQQKSLCQLENISGIFHAHSTFSDGMNSIEDMARGCQKKNWSYLGLTDHSQTAAYARGLKPGDVKRQLQEIAAVEKKLNFRIFRGIESDILKDGSLDYSAEDLQTFEFIIASIHSRYGQKDMTERLLKAIQNPATSMIGHISGRLLLAREAYTVDYERVIREAIQSGTVIELNCNPHRLDIDWRHLHEATRAGLLISLNPDAHSLEGLEDIQFGVWMARKALADKKSIINTWSLSEIEKFLQKKEGRMKAQKIPASPERMDEILKILSKTYPEAECSLDFETPFQLLAATILSAQCTDKRVNMVTPVLFKKISRRKKMSTARLTEIEKIIQSTGFFRQKAKSLKSMSESLMTKFGGKVPDTMEELIQLRGTGRKTANVVLGNAFNKAEGVVVDTHVKRISFRLGLTKEKDPEKIEKDLMKIIPQKDWVLFPHWIILHGRAICIARSPKCDICPLSKICPKHGVLGAKKGG